jgi:hypothetical protein
MAHLKSAKRVLSIVLIILPVLYLGFLIPDRCGVWDRMSGLSLVEDLEARYQISYGTDAGPIIRVGDKEWQPLLCLIRRYGVKLPADGQPKMIVRYKAVDSARVPAEGPIVAEWTAPSTPIVVVFRDVTDAKESVPREDAAIIGTIGDLQNWILRAKDDRRFWVQDVFLGIFGPLLGIVIFLIDWKQESAG